MREIVILGSTGSIGVQALEIVAANPGKFKVVGLSAGSNNLELLIAQAKKFNVPIVGTTADTSAIKDGIAEVHVIDGATAAAQIASLP